MSALVAISLFAAALGPEAFLGSESLSAIEVKRLPADASAALWRSLPGRTIWALPQQSVHLNDGAANRAVVTSPRAVIVRAAYDDRSLAIALEWQDETESRASDVDQFADSAAIELPMRFGAGVRLPYVGMGDQEQHVALYLSRAMASGSSGKEMIAAGFGSSTRADMGGALVSMHYEDRTWRAVFVRSLSIEGHDLRRGLVPIAIAVWDGERYERGGNKALSGWKFLRLSRWPIDQKYVGELSFGYAPGELGDPARGKPLVESICTACHHVGDVRTAPPGMAPDLSLIGAIATPRYLLGSIVDPKAPIVPRLHSSRTTVAEMPSFDSMSKEEIADMVAYLWSLGRKR